MQVTQKMHPNSLCTLCTYSTPLSFLICNYLSNGCVVSWHNPNMFSFSSKNAGQLHSHFVPQQE